MDGELKGEVMRKVGEERELPVVVRFSRLMSNRDGDTMCLSLECRTSGIEFAEIEMSMEQFGKLVAGCCDVRLEAELRGLEFVGKKLVRERRSVKCPLTEYSAGNNVYAKWLTDNCQEEGWMLDTYLGSQGSVVKKYDEPFSRVNYAVYKYVDVAEE
jgi:hypothetical protein